MKRANACDLFSHFTNDSCMIHDQDLLEGDEIVACFCTQNSIFILKKVFP